MLDAGVVAEPVLAERGAVLDGAASATEPLGRWPAKWRAGAASEAPDVETPAEGATAPVERRAAVPSPDLRERL
jgi:hypothetical protein